MRAPSATSLYMVTSCFMPQTLGGSAHHVVHARHGWSVRLVTHCNDSKTDLKCESPAVVSPARAESLQTRSRHHAPHAQEPRGGSTPSIRMLWPRLIERSTASTRCRWTSSRHVGTSLPSG